MADFLKDALPLPYGQRNEGLRRGGQRYRRFKQSSMTLKEFCEEADKAARQAWRHGILTFRYPNLFQLRKGIRELSLMYKMPYGTPGHYSSCQAYIKEVLRHEGVHGRVVRKTSQRMGVNIPFGYAIDVRKYHNPIPISSIIYSLRGVLFGNFDLVLKLIGKYSFFSFQPYIDWNWLELAKSVGWSKERFIEFLDSMYMEHDHPSEGDKILREYV